MMTWKGWDGNTISVLPSKGQGAVKRAEVMCFLRCGNEETRPMACSVLWPCVEVREEFAEPVSRNAPVKRGL